LFLVPPTTPMAAVNSSMDATTMIMVAGVMRASLIAWYGRFTLITHTPITIISSPTIYQPQSLKSHIYRHLTMTNTYRREVHTT